MTPSLAAEPTPPFAAARETATPREVQTEAPMRFVLPSPGAEPVSGWRPPLYPIPWAVTSYDHFYFTRPNPADQVNWPQPDYRYGGVFFANEVHTGVDIDAFLGTPVLAAGSGTVVWAGGGFYTGVVDNTTDPYGLAVSIRHDFGYQGKPLFTLYAHMSQVDVTVGQHVEAGEQIGLVGETGKTTGPHLHFEVRLGENLYHHTLNPELWLSPPQGWGVLVGRLHQYNGLLLESTNVRVISDETGVIRVVRTYGSQTINPDPYYQENMVLSDLPAGLYQVSMVYDGRDHRFWVEILPGQATYFTYTMYGDFKLIPPPTPALDFVPMTPTPTATRRP
ncbi:MAG: M23 family metallopeptidase [Chloroflexi bacterium]|nr:M23 family metallopeptidase [Chloroflexota bacterium]